MAQAMGARIKALAQRILDSWSQVEKAEQIAGWLWRDDGYSLNIPGGYDDTTDDTRPEMVKQDDDGWQRLNTR